MVGDAVGDIPKCTVSRVVSRVSTALVRKQHKFIPWRSTAAKRQEIKQGFLEKGGFPGVIGCIDETHICIQGPNAHKSDFLNRKGFHSITVPVICNRKDKHRVLMVETYFFISNSVCTSHRIAIHLNSFIALPYHII